MVGKIREKDIAGLEAVMSIICMDEDGDEKMI